MRIRYLLLVTIAYLSLASCTPTRSVSKISYQSFRTTFAQPDKEHPIPEDAEIVLMYDISDKGDFNVVVYNKTDEIMTIDQTKSFFVSSSGKSQSYFDPTIRTISQTNSSSTSRGTSVNLGAIANVLGVGGTVGSLLYGVNVGGGSSNGVAVTEVTQMADQPTVSLAPRSYAAMSKTFNEPMIGRDVISTNLEMTEKTSHCNFSFCISYSLDGGVSYKKLVTDFYSNSRIVVPVSKNEQLNDALKEIFRIKPDAIYEPFYQLIFDDNLYSSYDIYTNGLFFDFK
ncbi:MAG: hypothetical protein II981_01370 [Bacteroidales bacterium]|nr:hypothetical protein [Bacteroidales bacterium]MBQ3594048.1 hypothetical protein [Bacteroidales bacterium]